ncbi:MAG: orotidine-5'-phosphate decarboxylase, partial [Chloroflexota bacterium]
HEIPNSVAQAVHSAGRLGVDIVTVHASGGRKMIEAAVRASSDYPGMKICALTVVTGLDQNDLAEIGFSQSPENQALTLAMLAKESGCHGVIASAQEAQSMRKALGKEMLIITPGIRPSGSQKHDQSRVGTPSESIKAGASMLIVGRPITQAKNLKEVADRINQEIWASIS